MPKELTFSEFMKHMVALISKQHISMPLKDERPWHSFFYSLKREGLGDQTPNFLKALRFDWDGPYPKSQDVSAFLHALHWNAGVSARNPHYQSITLPEEVSALWTSRQDTLDPPIKEMLNKALDVAKREFAS